MGYPIEAAAVWEILHAAGIDPAPRRTGPTWRQFLTAQAHAIIACDFLVVETMMGRCWIAMGDSSPMPPHRPRRCESVLALDVEQRFGG
ncbi:hypothetical protein [Nonomuraea sp. PA05]|uniref:hypothetical protein n=1 Tax=Nonomuraea sp. PA05 TaxID=2604466 RepID=UPI001CA3624E|nr:hypothetical protein [Nonomuraea sp. PA05]